MRAIGPEFNTNRMVRQYTEEMYLPAFRRSEELEEKNYERTHKFVEWQQRVHKQWNNIRIDNISIDTAAGLKVGDNCIIRAKVFLGELKPEDVSVQAYYGVLDAGGEIYQPLAIAMKDGGKHEVSQAQKHHGDLLACEHIGIKTNGEREHPRQVADDLDGEHERGQPPERPGEMAALRERR